MKSRDTLPESSDDEQEIKKRRRKRSTPRMPLDAVLESGADSDDVKDETKSKKTKKRSAGKKKASAKTKQETKSQSTDTAKSSKSEKNVVANTVDELRDTDDKKSAAPEESADNATEHENDLGSDAAPKLEDEKLDDAVEQTEADAGDEDTRDALEDAPDVTAAPKAKASATPKTRSKRRDNSEAVSHAKRQPKAGLSDEGHQSTVEDEQLQQVVEQQAPHVLTEPEGELFVSERWRRQRGEASAEAPQQAVSHDVHNDSGEADNVREQYVVNDVPVPIEHRYTEAELPAAARNIARDKHSDKQTKPRPVSARRTGAGSPASLVGAAIGASVGAAAERSRAKKQQAATERQQHRIEKLENKLEATEQTLERKTESQQRSKRTKTELESRLERLRKQTIEHNTKQVKQSVERDRSRPEPSVTLSSSLRETQAQREVVSQASAERTTQQAAKAVARQEAAEAAETLEVPKDHRVEHSAWHSIEVDKKTGKMAQEQHITYGREFRHEQEQETLRKQINAVSVDSQTLRAQYESHDLLAPKRPAQQRTTASTAATPTSNVTPKSPASPASTPASPDATKRVSPLSPAKPAHVPSSQLRVAQPASLMDIAMWIGLGVVVLAILFALGLF